MLRLSLLNPIDNEDLLPKNFHPNVRFSSTKSREKRNRLDHPDVCRAHLTPSIVRRGLRLDEDRQKHFLDRIASKRKVEENIFERFSMYQSTRRCPSSISMVRQTTTTTRQRKKEICQTIRFDRCSVSMIYLGRKIFANQSQSNEDEILLLQQHSGGENLPVFKGFLKPNDRFQFVSRRHPDYPFALTFYINGIIDSRLSTCCEMKHQLGIPLGGPKGSFIIEHIQRGKYCRQCRFQQFIKSKFRPNQNQIGKEEKEEKEEEIIDESTLAKELYEKVKTELNQTIDWEKKCFLNWQLGNICFQGFHQSDRASEYYLNAFEILLERIPSTDRRLRDFYLILSLIFEEKNLNLSKKYFQRLLEIDLNTKHLDENILFSDYYFLSKLFQKEENYSSALICAEKSLQYRSIDVSRQRFFPDYSPRNMFDQNLFDYLFRSMFPTKDQIEDNFTAIRFFLSTSAH